VGHCHSITVRRIASRHAGGGVLDAASLATLLAHGAPLRGLRLRALDKGQRDDKQHNWAVARQALGAAARSVMPSAACECGWCWRVNLM